MFAKDFEGYNKKEVDSYIAKMKTDLLEKKLNLLNAEEKFLQLKQKFENTNGMDIYKNSEIIDKVEKLMIFLFEKYPKIKDDRFVQKETFEIFGKQVCLQKENKTESKSKRVKIKRNMIPVFNNCENYENFFSQEPKDEAIFKNLESKNNGFDIEEAVNPTEDLDEIMKAFDFFNN